MRRVNRARRQLTEKLSHILRDKSVCLRPTRRFLASAHLPRLCDVTKPALILRT